MSFDNKFTRWICRLIPKYISERGMVRILNFLRRLNRRGEMYSFSHEGANKAIIRRLIADNGSLIENQMAYTDVYIGMESLALAGCEAIALYNSLKYIESINNKKGKELFEIISMLEKDGIVLSGGFGVAPGALYDSLKRMGYKARYFIPKKGHNAIPSYILDGDAIIITYYNDGEDLYAQIHTIAVTKKDCKYLAHNIYCNGYVHGPFDSLEELIKGIGQGKAKAIMYISIS